MMELPGNLAMPRSILIIEDYSDLRSAIASTLVRRDYSCDSAQSPDDAIVKLSSQHYGTILLSPRLPIRSDPVMCFLRESQPEEIHKVILMTDPESDDEIDPDPDDCRVLIKPFGDQQLFARLTP